jgi:hypothetical protein
MAGLNFAIDLIRAGKLNEAESYLIDELEKSPSNEGMWRFLGRTQADLKKREEAIFSIKKAIKLNPEQPMWLYKQLVELELHFEYIESCKEIGVSVRNILSKPEEIRNLLNLDSIEYPVEIFNGDGLLGKQIMYKAIFDKELSFISPFDGSLVKSNKSITDYVYWFEEGFYLSFFSDWAYPFLAYQIFIEDSKKVIWGYLDLESNLYQYSVNAVDSFTMYFASLFRVLYKFDLQINSYIKNTKGSRVIVKNQNFKHLGHAIWNGLSAITPFINNESWHDRVDSFFVNASVFDRRLLTEFNKNLIHYSGVEKNFELDVFTENLFVITLKDNYVPNTLSISILRSAIENVQDSSQIESFRKSFFPIVLLGVRLGTRQWLNQSSVYGQMIKQFESEYPNIGFVIDGMNSIDGDVHSSHGSIDLKSEIELANTLAEGKNNVISMVGTTLIENLPWIEMVDFCVTPWGAGLAKYKWIHNKKCIVVSSKCVLTEKKDVHIYDSEDFLEYAIPDDWIDGNFTTNEMYPTMSDFRLLKSPKVQYYYQDFKCDKDEVIRLVKLEIEESIKKQNFILSNSLKVLNRG